MGPQLHADDRGCHDVFTLRPNTSALSPMQRLHRVVAFERFGVQTVFWRAYLQLLVGAESTINKESPMPCLGDSRARAQ